MTSKSIYTPYFYIIEHISSGKFYGGSRWADQEFKKKTSKSISNSKKGKVSGENNPFFGKYIPKNQNKKYEIKNLE